MVNHGATHNFKSIIDMREIFVHCFNFYPDNLGCIANPQKDLPSMPDPLPPSIPQARGFLITVFFSTMLLFYTATSIILVWSISLSTTTIPGTFNLLHYQSL